MSYVLISTEKNRAYAETSQKTICESDIIHSLALVLSLKDQYITGPSQKSGQVAPLKI